MHFVLLTTIFTLTLTAEANDSGTRQLRSGRQSKNVICRYISSGVYETTTASKLTELLYIATKVAVKGDCSTNAVCKRLCANDGDFTTTDTQCRCLTDTTTTSTTTLSQATTAAPIPSPVATVAPVTSKPTSAPTLAPVTSKPTSAPTLAPVTSTPSSAPTLAPVMLTKTPTTSTTTTKTEFCSNPYGNPCGPGSACTDTETGISCAPINLEGCPVGCGPNSSCMLQQNAYECICNTGFSRPQKYLPCIATP